MLNLDSAQFGLSDRELIPPQTHQRDRPQGVRQLPRLLAAASAALSERRHALAHRGITSRVAAYTTGEPGADVVRLATEHDVDLTLVDAGPDLLESGLPDHDLGTVLERAPCDVGVLSGTGERRRTLQEHV